MTRFSLAGLVLAMLFSACSKFEIETSEGKQSQVVNLQISTGGWNGSATRVDGSELLTPVTLLLVQSGGSKVVTRKVVENDDFSIEVPNGSYDIFAVCGLPSDIVPDNLFEEIEIPQAEGSTGLTDFAVGSATIINEYGKVSPSSASIAAKRQMAWLTVNVSDVPEEFTEIFILVQGLADGYNLAHGWNTSDEAQYMSTKFSLSQKPLKKALLSTDLITIPCTATQGGTNFRIVGKTNENKTLVYSYASKTPLVAGKHLTLNLSISTMSLVSETVSMEDWDEKSEDGTLKNPALTGGN